MLARARAAAWRAIVDDLAPLWLGTPWGLGSDSAASRPYQPGMVVGCSYFVTAIAEGAGLKLDDRFRFAQAPALTIQRALARGKRAILVTRSAPKQAQALCAGNRCDETLVAERFDKVLGGKAAWRHHQRRSGRDWVPVPGPQPHLCAAG